MDVKKNQIKNQVKKTNPLNKLIYKKITFIWIIKVFEKNYLMI